MQANPISRRGFFSGALALGGAAALAGCVGGKGSDSGSSGRLVIQSDLSDPDPKKAMEAVVKAWRGKKKLTLNTVAVETFRAQLPTYLSSSNPPDVITWLAGSVARDYASKGFLLDVSDVWDKSLGGYSQALQDLSSDASGKKIFIPTSYYWWGIFYRKSMFTKWGVQPATTWSEFLDLCAKLKGMGVNPLTMGTGSTAWVASGWFDYLNLRVNGQKFHLDLLAGKESFDSPQVKDTMKAYAQILPYFDRKGRSYAWQEAVTPLVQGKAAMYLIGAFMTSAVPAEVVDDLDFFRVPVINQSVQNAEEAPTDGYFASSKTKDAAGTKELLTYLASPQTQQLYIEKAKSSNLPTSSKVSTANFSPLVKKGIQFLNESKGITQFFNRDSSDELQTTADAALTKFLDDPKDVDKILASWQSAAHKVLSK